MRNQIDRHSTGDPAPEQHLRTEDRPPSERERRESSAGVGLGGTLARHPHAVRVLNVVVALLGLFLTAPLMLVIALLVKLTSRGPVLYRQVRVGLDRRGLEARPGRRRRRVDFGGRLFTIYKFRTMRADSHRAGQVWASPDDPRITRLGRVLRKLRLDELPQLVNVLKGDMNIVGPRPEQPEIFWDMRHRIHRYGSRQKVLPGITGWAQVNHPYDQSVDDVRRKVDLDLEYIEKRSIWKDLRIMLRTLPVIFLRRGSL
jgi:lipopolysaccharide/colanic/teichoic acid biosynthesis glycosyltransferase